MDGKVFLTAIKEISLGEVHSRSRVTANFTIPVLRAKDSVTFTRVGK